MLYRVLADTVVVLHLGFVLFVVLGGLLVLRWPRLAWLHIPGALWGAMIELAGWSCPLTPLERHLRRTAGQQGYEHGFIEHYIVSLIYPGGLTRTHQVLMGIAVLAVNLTIYFFLWRRLLRARQSPEAFEDSCPS